MPSPRVIVTTALIALAAVAIAVRVPQIRKLVYGG